VKTLLFFKSQKGGLFGNTGLTEEALSTTVGT
jgi:hypothetical protein